MVVVPICDNRVAINIFERDEFITLLIQLKNKKYHQVPIVTPDFVDPLCHKDSKTQLPISSLTEHIQDEYS
jgi:hypothetical protein